VLGRVAEAACPTLDCVVAVIHLALEQAAIGHLPGRHVLGRVARAMLHVLAALEDEHLQALLGQLFRGPAASDAGADDDGIELLRLAHDVHCLPSNAKSTLPS
jgi:hypothetical protein